MITQSVTDKQLKKWKLLFDEYGKKLAPNRKTGEELDEYFRGKYDCTPYSSEKFASVVEWNILNNEVYGEKLRGAKPKVKCYKTGEVLIGIDIVGGEFVTECKDIGQAAKIYDDLFVFRGLDESDLKNFVLVGQYLELKNDRSKRHN